MKLVLLGDGADPQLLQWARMLQPRVRLAAVSCRGFAPGWELLLPDADRLALNLPDVQGDGALAMIKVLPKLGPWLADADADWIHAHGLTLNGTLAWAAKLGWRLRARIIGSAHGHDILSTPYRGAAWRWLMRKALRSCAITTTEYRFVAEQMQALGAPAVVVLPEGPEAMPRQNVSKDRWLCFSHSAMKLGSDTQQVIDAFASLAAIEPQARLVLAGDGPLRDAFQAHAAASGLAHCIDFVGDLSVKAEAAHLARASWFFRLGGSELAAAPVLKAIAHGCVPVLSDHPGHRELIADGERGLVLGALLELPQQMVSLDADRAAGRGRDWVAAHALLEPQVQQLLTRLRALGAP